MTRTRYRLIFQLMALAVLAFAVVPAEAAEPAEALSPFAGDVGNAVWTVAIFVLVVVVLGKFAWGPILSSLQQREEFIHTSLSSAKRDREAAEARLAEYGAKLQSARTEAFAIVDEARRDAERLREETKQKARAEAEQVVRNAERQIELETATGHPADPQRGGGSVGDDRFEIIQRNITKEDNSRLIDEALAQIGEAGKTASPVGPEGLVRAPYLTPKPTIRAPGSFTPTVTSSPGTAFAGPGPLGVTMYSIIISPAI